MDKHTLAKAIFLHRLTSNVPIPDDMYERQHPAMKQSFITEAEGIIAMLDTILPQEGDKYRKMALILRDYEVSPFGEVLCAACHHSHSDGSWTERDPNDGTCWNAGSLVCGCPKFITPAVHRIRMDEWKRRREREAAATK